jgi:alpha-L-fucosidase
MLKPEPTKGDTAWFVQDRFGMFIHWGLYALPARHEWVKSFERIDDAGYQKYFEHFDPDLYDPGAWARSAREAGMKYAVLTTKHHEGFCLWDSQLTDYKVTNTPCGRDLLRPFVDAFREAGLKIGFYHSLLDWHHPHYPIDPHHPMRDHAEAPEWNKERDIRIYAEYLHGQVRELLTGYGKIDIMWFDFSNPDDRYRGMPGKGRKDWQSERLLQMVRELQPGIIVNNRLDLPTEDVDFHTPEQFEPRTWVHVEGKPVVWEGCHTLSGSWGYHRDEQTWKSPAQLIQLLVNTVSRGGNLIMNVGPTARGTFDRRAQDALQVYRDWMAVHSRAIYGCTQSEYAEPANCRLTQNGRRLYVHMFSWPFEALYLPGLAGRVEYAQLLHDGSEIPFSVAGAHHPQVTPLDPAEREGETLMLKLPVRKPDVVVPVVELFLR